jgi:hypothetical protein
MTNQAYITLMGRSGWAVVNSFYASIIETDYRPDQVHLIYESEYANDIDPVMRGLEIIQSSYATPNVKALKVPNWDAHATGHTIRELVQDLQKEKSEMALDITGGRKALVTGALLTLKGESMKHIFYLAIDTTEGVAKPYLMIAKRVQKLMDIITNAFQNEKMALDTKTGETNLLLSRECVMVLLNQVYSRGEKIVVKAPLVGVDILELDLQNQKVVMKTDRSNYEKKSRAYEYEGSDHPTYSDLRRCLCHCGVLEYENENEFHEMLTSDLSRSFDPNSRVRRSFLSLDSNMFYNGFPSTLAKLEQRLGIPPKDVICITPYAVRTEVQKKIRGKYRKDAIYAAKDFYRADYLDVLVDEFTGQNMLATRVGKMAKSQMMKFMNRPVHMMIGNDEELPRNSEDVDHLIVAALKQYARERGIRVVFVSSDKNIRDICELAEDVYPLILRMPQEIPRTMKASDEVFVNLLVGLSLVYGVVELEKIGYLFGEYKGKQSEVYMNEVKLRLRNLQRGKILQERVDTCKKLKELKIAR